MIDTIIDLELNESFRIGNDVVIKVFRSPYRNQAKFGIIAPRHIAINRLEIYQRIQGDRYGKSSQES